METPIWNSLSKGARFLYLYLMWRSGTRGYCWPTVETIAKNLGMSERNVRVKAQELRVANAIRIEKQGRKNIFHVLDLSVSEEDEIPAKSAGEYRQNLPPKGKEDKRDISLLPILKKEKIPKGISKKESSGVREVLLEALGDAELVDDWIAHREELVHDRNKKGKKLTLLGAKQFVAKLRKCADLGYDYEDIRSAMGTSIESGWPSIYLDQKGPKSGGHHGNGNQQGRRHSAEVAAERLLERLYVQTDGRRGVKPRNSGGSGSIH